MESRRLAGAEEELEEGKSVNTLRRCQDGALGEKLA